MLEFVDSDLYFVQDKNDFINPLLHVGSGSNEKSTGSGSGGPKIDGSHQIRILIPDYKYIYCEHSVHGRTCNYTTKYSMAKDEDMNVSGRCKGMSFQI